MFTPHHILSFTFISLLALNGCTPPDDLSQPVDLSPPVDLPQDESSTPAQFCSPTIVYQDNDGDGYGFDLIHIPDCIAPAGAVTLSGDCDDLDPAKHPNAPEVCDGKDQDCDTLIDEEPDPAVYQYPDIDRDGYGYGRSINLTVCPSDLLYSTSRHDCDDLLASVHPGAPEVCDGIDNDCNEEIDEGIEESLFYQDNDGDGYAANPAGSMQACGTPGHTKKLGDCDDDNSSINPEGIEVCDDVDHDCDGETDDIEVGAKTYYIDSDNDGFGSWKYITVLECEPTPGYTSKSGDCDDSDKSISPHGIELCDGIDNNCDGTADEWDATTFWLDEDQDGYGTHQSPITLCGPSAAYSLSKVDCDDRRSERHPGAPDEDGDGIDQDCGGSDGQQPSVDLPGSQYSSIEAAVGASKSGDIIWIGAAIQPIGSVNLVDKSISIRGTHGAENTVLEREGLESAFIIDPYSSLDLRNLTLRGAGQDGETASSAIQITWSELHGHDIVLEENHAFNGGAIESYNGSIRLEHSLIQNNRADSSGGGINATSGSIVLNHVTFTGNSSEQSGGAIKELSSSIEINDSTFNLNKASSAGAIYFYSQEAKIHNSSFSENLATYSGGAISHGHYPIEIMDCMFRKNQSKDGGAIFTVSPNELTIESSAFYNNQASLRGGAIYGFAGEIDIADSHFQSNVSGEAGAIYQYKGHLFLQGNQFLQNEALAIGSYAGGGALSIQEGELISEEDSFIDNSTEFHGGGLSLIDSSASLFGTEILNNSSTSFGGGLYLESSTLSMEDTLISGNEVLDIGDGSEGGGGIALLLSSSMDAYNSTISSNAAQSHGGGMLMEGSTATLSSVDISENSANYGSGGGIFLDEGTLTAENLHLSNNSAYVSGGGFYVGHAGEANITYLTAENNESQEYGGAAQVYGKLNLNHGVFLSNTSRVAGAISATQSNVLMRHSVFAGNQGEESAGAIRIDLGKMILMASIFSDNESPRGNNLSIESDNFHEAGNVFWDHTGQGGWPSWSHFTPSPSSVIAAPSWLTSQPQDSLWNSNLHLGLQSPGVDIAGADVCLELGLNVQLCQDQDGSDSDAGIFGGPDGLFWDVDNDTVSDYPWPGTFNDRPSTLGNGIFDSDDRNAFQPELEGA